MRRNRGAALSQFFDDLMAGDAFAIGFISVFLVVGIAIWLFAMKIRRDHKREDEARKNKWLKKK